MFNENKNSCAYKWISHLIIYATPSYHEMAGLDRWHMIKTQELLGPLSDLYILILRQEQRFHQPIIGLHYRGRCQTVSKNQEHLVNSPKVATPFLQVGHAGDCIHIPRDSPKVLVICRICRDYFAHPNKIMFYNHICHWGMQKLPAKVVSQENAKLKCVQISPPSL